MEQKFGVGALQRLSDVAKATAHVVPTGLSISID
jgi:hypothetical protein